eukprot:COSAG04_NODE_1018_length_8737_cov_2.901250_7_plen_302_part_00
MQPQPEPEPEPSPHTEVERLSALKSRFSHLQQVSDGALSPDASSAWLREGQLGSPQLSETSGWGRSPASSPADARGFERSLLGSLLSEPTPESTPVSRSARSSSSAERSRGSALASVLGRIERAASPPQTAVHIPTDGRDTGAEVARLATALRLEVKRREAAEAQSADAEASVKALGAEVSEAAKAAEKAAAAAAKQADRRYSLLHSQLAAAKLEVLQRCPYFSPFAQRSQDHRELTRAVCVQRERLQASEASLQLEHEAQSQALATARLRNRALSAEGDRYPCIYVVWDCAKGADEVAGV